MLLSLLLESENFFARVFQQQQKQNEERILFFAVVGVFFFFCVLFLFLFFFLLKLATPWLHLAKVGYTWLKLAKMASRSGFLRDAIELLENVFAIHQVLSRLHRVFACCLLLAAYKTMRKSGFASLASPYALFLIPCNVLQIVLCIRLTAPKVGQ